MFCVFDASICSNTVESFVVVVHPSEATGKLYAAVEFQFYSKSLDSVLIVNSDCSLSFWDCLNLFSIFILNLVLFQLCLLAGCYLISCNMMMNMQFKYIKLSHLV